MLNSEPICIHRFCGRKISQPSVCGEPQLWLAMCSCPQPALPVTLAPASTDACGFLSKAPAASGWHEVASMEQKPDTEGEDATPSWGAPGPPTPQSLEGQPRYMGAGGAEAVKPPLCARPSGALHIHHVSAPSWGLLRCPGCQEDRESQQGLRRASSTQAHFRRHVISNQGALPTLGDLGLTRTVWEQVGGLLAPQGLQMLERTPSARLGLWVMGASFFLLSRGLAPTEPTVTGETLLGKQPSWQQ